MNLNSLLGIFVAVVLIVGGALVAMKVYLARTDGYDYQTNLARHPTSEPASSGQPVGIFEKETADNRVQVVAAAPNIIAPSVRGGLQRNPESAQLDNEDQTEEEESDGTDPETEQSAAHSEGDAETAEDEFSEAERSDSDSDMREQTAHNDDDAALDNPEPEQQKTPRDIQPRDAQITRAVWVQMLFDDAACNQTGLETPTVAVDFRSGSAAVKGNSLSILDLVVDVYRECPARIQLLAHNAAQSDSSESLLERRKQEVKYHFLRRQVPKDRILLEEPEQ